MYATLLVLAGYLAAEIFLSGFPAALAVFALGVAEYIFLIAVKRTSHPSLILEGAVLAGIGMAGHRLSALGYGGGEFVLLELVLGGVLIVSTLLGKPWLASQMRRISGLSAGGSFAREASMAMGSLFLLHGLFMGFFVIRTGRIPVPWAILVFAVLYIAVMKLLRVKQRNRAQIDAPGLVSLDDGRVVLVRHGRELGSMMLKPATAALVSEVQVKDGIQVQEFLESLEYLLRSRGCRAVRITGLEEQELQLELSGYRHNPAGWSKPL